MERISGGCNVTAADLEVSDKEASVKPVLGRCGLMIHQGRSRQALDTATVGGGGDRTREKLPLVTHFTRHT
jgi:hypothetical protein